MSASRSIVLAVVPSPTLARHLELALAKEGVDLRCFPTAAAGLAELAKVQPCLTLVDADVTDLPPARALAEFRDALPPSVPVLLLADGPGQHAVDRHDVKRIALLTRPQATLPKARLLVVDDSAVYRHYLRGELQAVDYVVETETNPQHALARLRQEPFDCVIVDLVMPGVDGSWLCSELHRLRVEEGLLFFIIVLTSRENPSDQVSSLAAGADDFVGKSADLSILKARLAALWRRRSLLEGGSAQQRGSSKE